MNRQILPALIGASVMAWGMPFVVYLLQMHHQCVEIRSCSLLLFSYGPWGMLAASIVALAGPVLLARFGKRVWATALAVVMLLAGSVFGVVALDILTGI